VEFFKTDVHRRCPQCGKRVQNPKVSLGCAKWCAYAKECLGFDPDQVQMSDTAELSLIDQLVDAVKKQFGDNQDGVTHSLLVLDRAQDLMRREGGDPKVVMAAALLHDIGVPAAAAKHGSTEPKYQEVEGAVIARQVLEGLGLEDEAVDQVCDIVRSHHSGDGADTPEFRIVWDADRLEEAPPGLANCQKDLLEGVIARVFRTEAGRQRALKQFARV
jgi:putative nucleotidyltransferase with HDIG domain